MSRLGKLSLFFYAAMPLVALTSVACKDDAFEEAGEEVDEAAEEVEDEIDDATDG